MPSAHLAVLGGTNRQERTAVTRLPASAPAADASDLEIENLKPPRARTASRLWRRRTSSAMRSRVPIIVACLALLAGGALGACPRAGELPADHPPVLARALSSAPSSGRAPAAAARSEYEAAVRALPLEAVKADLRALFTASRPEWPADYGHYGPLFVRLAWHCSGSYRVSDGRGGCEGGRQRFDPERSWADNTNLDKARALLWPLKKKYGLGLSWGDLFVLAGTTAVEAMGGPTLGFCAGRVDDDDGGASEPLGPSAAQEARWPCRVNGTCVSPLGSTTVGLIYVNPEGPMGAPHPAGSAAEVRDTFRRMSMNDSETVALIGGGHSFGKAHGACPAGAGPSPRDDPASPWPGRCGTGRGADAFTSGIEGPWTPEPTRWDYSYFPTLLAHKWVKHRGPGGAWQWRVAEGGGDDAPSAPAAHGPGRQPTMMLTSDLSLAADPAYHELAASFASDRKRFDDAWSHAWYKLTTRDMGPRSRCVGALVPPAQPWQHPLPPPPAEPADFGAVAKAVRSLLAAAAAAEPAAGGLSGGAAGGAGAGAGEGAGGPPPLVAAAAGASAPAAASPAALLARLAYRCAATFRATDWRGGCDGARIRHEPEASWPANAGLGEALELLRPVKKAFGERLSWADLIVLAGSEAVRAAGAPHAPFCPGRTDAADGSASKPLAPVLSDAPGGTVGDLREAISLSGLSAREWVALRGLRSLGEAHPPYAGASTLTPHALSAAYFSNLIELRWTAHTVRATGAREYRARDGRAGTPLYMLHSDLLLTLDAELLALVMEYAADERAWLHAFAAAWVKLMNLDRFDGPVRNACDDVDEGAGGADDDGRRPGGHGGGDASAR